MYQSKDKIAELQNYKGSSPCPNDIDEYWGKGLKELEEIDPEVELVPAEFKSPNAECFHLYFKSMGGARIHAKLHKPKKVKNASPAILSFHGYTANSGDWITQLPYCAGGITVASMDCRGQGGKSEDNAIVFGNTHNGHIVRGIQENPNKLMFRNIFLDTVQLAKIIMKLDFVDSERIGAMGGSQGGALTLACASLVPQIKRIGVWFPFLSDYKKVYELGVDGSAYAEIKEYFRRFDPTHENEDDFFYKLGYIDVQNLAKNITADTLMGISLSDPATPPPTQFAAYNKIRSKKRNILYPDFGHENLPGFPDACYQHLIQL